MGAAGITDEVVVRTAALQLAGVCARVSYNGLHRHLMKYLDSGRLGAIAE